MRGFSANSILFNGNMFDRSSSTNTSAGCGPIMIRLSWHDAGVFNGQNGCPNAAMRLAGGGEYAFGANAGDWQSGTVRTEPGSNGREHSKSMRFLGYKGAAGV